MLKSTHVCDLCGTEHAQVSQGHASALDLSASAGSLLAECLEILEDVLDETVDATSYPDGPNLAGRLRQRIKKALRQAENDREETPT